MSTNVKPQQQEKPFYFTNVNVQYAPMNHHAYFESLIPSL
jgi:hypothetical protein